MATRMPSDDRGGTPGGGDDKPCMPRHRKKSELPQKVCPVCRRPFIWRKKWARDWDRVVYCSERCRRSKAVAT